MVKSVGERISIEFGESLAVEWDLDAVRGLSQDGKAPWQVRGSLEGRFSALRVLTGLVANGPALLLAGARPNGSAGHDSEQPRALLADGRGAVTEFDEALVSTQYGADGSIARVGLELYKPGDDYPVRGAGDVVSLVRNPDAEPPTEGAWLDFRLDGDRGIAFYEIQVG